MRKLLLILLSFVSIFSFSGCNGTQNWTEEEPVYTTDKEFTIGMWVGVPNSINEYDSDTGEIISKGNPISNADFLNYYKDIKDCGINLAYPGYGEESEAYNIRALNAASQVGIKQLISDQNVKALLLSDVLSDEQIITKVKEISAYFIDHPAFAGLMIKDEPSFNQIADYEHAKELFDQIFPGKIFYINLLPVIASPSYITDNYSNYIKEYVERINTGFVSYDHYPLLMDAKGNTVLLENFLYNMDLAKRAAPDKEIWTFLQSIGYSPKNRSLKSTADATFQMYSFLAYGGLGIQWFCYWSPPAFDGATYFDVGMIDRNGAKTPAYDYVKTANMELRSFQNIYLNFDWQGVMTKIGRENDNGGDNNNFGYISKNVIASHDRIKKFDCQQDTLIGVFKDKENRDGFMVVNFTEPGKNLSSKVNMEFNDCARAIVVKDGKKEIVNIKEGKLTLDMESGDGCFVIPLK